MQPQMRVQTFVSGPDKEGIKTITEYRTEDSGRKVQVIRKVKETVHKTRIHKAVLERRQWKKFGVCKGLPPGPEHNITYSSHEQINLQLKCKTREEDQSQEEDDPLQKLKGSSFTCRNCGESGHWTLQCPKRAEIVVEQKPRPNEDRSAAPSRGAAPSAYVPPSLRAGGSRSEGGAGGPGGDRGREDDSSNQIRVTNICEDTTENDLRVLFRPFGNTSRVYLAKDKQTNTSRGFAFITFSERCDAEKAIAKLNGYGYGNLILHVEFAKPREEPGERPAAGTQGAGQPGWTMRGTR